jgi:hypothetical protein
MTTKIDPTPEDPLRALVQDYRNEAEVIHYSREGGFHEEPDWRSCTSIQCARMRAAIEKAEAALAAPPVAGAEADDGRPPLDPATIAHDKAYMAGVVRGRELEREAAALRSAAPALDELGTVSLVDIDVAMVRWKDGIVRSETLGKKVYVALRSTAPALDVERLTDVLADWTITELDRLVEPEAARPYAAAIAREYAALEGTPG